LSQVILPAPVEEELDGLQFRVIPFSAYHALGLLARLAKSIGPALSSLSGHDPNTDLKDLAPALRIALATLDPSEAQVLVLEVLKKTSVLLDDGSGKVAPRIEINTQEKFDKVFNGRFKTMFKAVGFALRMNFAGFIDGSESEPARALAPAR
jgi:hypothetical protein